MPLRGMLSWFSISGTGELLPERACKETSIATIESMTFLAWRLQSELMISVADEVLSDEALKEVPIATTESVMVWYSDIRY